MTRLSDRAVAHLASLSDAPVLDGTKYELREELGRGGMGTVYRALDHELNRDVALKVVHDAVAPPDVAIPGDAARLVREARALARLEHPGIVPVHDAGILPDGRIFYAMKLVRGERLDHFARDASLGDLLRLFVRVCDTVDFAHANGVMHRDLKPQNIMVGEFGEVLVMDWGVAKVERRALSVERRGADGAGEGRSVAASPSSHPVEARRPTLGAGDDTVTLEGVILGTPGYMSPEQALGDVARLDGRTDVYALGAILRDLVVAADGAGVRPLQSVIARATADAPDGRYSSPRALAADIEAHLDGLRVAAHRESLAERAWRHAARHRTAIALIVAYLAMRLVLLVVG